MDYVSDAHCDNGSVCDYTPVCHVSSQCSVPGLLDKTSGNHSTRRYLLRSIYILLLNILQTGSVDPAKNPLIIAQSLFPKHILYSFSGWLARLKGYNRSQVGLFCLSG